MHRYTPGGSGLGRGATNSSSVVQKRNLPATGTHNPPEKRPRSFESGDHVPTENNSTNTSFNDFDDSDLELTEAQFEALDNIASQAFSQIPPPGPTNAVTNNNGCGETDVFGIPHPKPLTTGDKRNSKHSQYPGARNDSRVASPLRQQRGIYTHPPAPVQYNPSGPGLSDSTPSSRCVTDPSHVLRKLSETEAENTSLKNELKKLNSSQMCKDGENKILREQLKISKDDLRRQIEDNSRNLAKKIEDEKKQETTWKTEVERLKSQLQFKDVEMNEIQEKNRRLTNQVAVNSPTLSQPGVNKRTRVGSPAVLKENCVAGGMMTRSSPVKLEKVVSGFPQGLADPSGYGSDPSSSVRSPAKSLAERSRGGPPFRSPHPSPKTTKSRGMKLRESQHETVGLTGPGESHGGCDVTGGELLALILDPRPEHRGGPGTVVPGGSVMNVLQPVYATEPHTLNSSSSSSNVSSSSDEGETEQANTRRPRRLSVDSAPVAAVPHVNSPRYLAAVHALSDLSSQPPSLTPLPASLGLEHIKGERVCRGQRGCVARPAVNILPLIDDVLTHYLDLQRAMIESNNPTPNPGGRSVDPSDTSIPSGGSAVSKPLFELAESKAYHALGLLLTLAAHCCCVRTVLLHTPDPDVAMETAPPHGAEGRVLAAAPWVHPDCHTLLEKIVYMSIPKQHQHGSLTECGLKILIVLSLEPTQHSLGRLFTMLITGVDGYTLNQCFNTEHSPSITLHTIQLLTTLVDRYPTYLTESCSKNNRCIWLSMCHYCLQTSKLLEQTQLTVIAQMVLYLTSVCYRGLVPSLLQRDCHCSPSIVKTLIRCLNRVMVGYKTAPIHRDKLHSFRSGHRWSILRGGLVVLQVFSVLDPLFTTHCSLANSQYTSLVCSFLKFTPELDDQLIYMLQDLWVFSQPDDDEWPKNED